MSGRQHAGAEGPGERARPLAALLLEGFRWFDRGLLAQLEQEGWPDLRAVHSLLFAHLDLESGTRTSELARRMGVSRQAAHQTVGELRAMGLVELRDDPTNASARLVTLTDRGRENVAAARRAFEALEAELGARLGQRAATELRDVLERDWGAPPGTQ